MTAQPTSTEYVTPADVTKISEPMARAILAQADAFMDDVRGSIHSIANRAAGLASVYSAGAVAGLAGAWSLSSNGKADEISWVVLFLLMFSILWTIAAILCAFVLRPRPTPPKGNEPASWLDHPALVEGSLIQAMVGEAERYQERIPDILSRLRSDACALRWAIYLGIAPPGIALLIFVARFLL